MKDEEGNLWFGYPNPRTEYMQNHFPKYGTKFDLREDILPDMGYFSRDFKNESIEGTDRPWLFTSGCIGLYRCEIPLIDETQDKSGVFSVRLGFIARQGDRKGQRVFDIKLQGIPVLENFDIIETAGKPGRAVIKEFKNIKAENILRLELTSKIENLTVDQAPIINFVEVLRDD